MSACAQATFVGLARGLPIKIDALDLAVSALLAMEIIATNHGGLGTTIDRAGPLHHVREAATITIGAVIVAKSAMVAAETGLVRRTADIATAVPVRHVARTMTMEHLLLGEMHAKFPKYKS